MRIAFLCKRKYMGKDVIDDRYARLYEIPFQLAGLGHEVRGWCLGYQSQPDGRWQHDATPGTLDWSARGLRGLKFPGLLAYPFRLLSELRNFDPDLLIGASDIPQVALTAWLAKRLDRPYVVDLYDNFESFGQAKIPGMVSLLRRATRNAALVTTTSELLGELVSHDYKARGEVMSLPSTVDTDIFRPMERAACRRNLGLPEQATIIGTAGGLHQEKGVGTLYEAWRKLAEHRPDLHMALAGPLDGILAPPADPRVHYLGMLPHAQAAELFNALDVGVIYLRDTPFGRYCFPQKAYEMAACKIPFVAAAVGAMTKLLASEPAGLYRPDDSGDLAERIAQQLDHPKVADIAVKNWRELISSVEPKLRAIVAGTGGVAGHASLQ